MQYDDDELEARQLGFVTVHCKHADTPPSNRSLLLLFFIKQSLLLVMPRPHKAEALSDAFV